MSAYLYGNFGSSAASRHLGMASAEVANSAARLASGVQSSGKLPGAILGASYDIAQGAAELSAESRDFSFQAGQWARASAMIEAAYSMALRALELEELADSDNVTAAQTAAYDAEKLALSGAITALMTDVGDLDVSPSVDEADVVLADLESGAALDDLALAAAEAAGEMTAAEMQSVAQSSQAAIIKESAQNYAAVDFGAETANLTRNQILQQAAAAMVAQANQSSNVILALFR